MKQAKYYNRETREPEELKQGDTLRIVQREKGKAWTKARVEEPVNIRSYRVKTEEGTGKASERQRETFKRKSMTMIQLNP